MKKLTVFKSESWVFVHGRPACRMSDIAITILLPPLNEQFSRNLVIGYNNVFVRTDLDLGDWTILFSPGVQCWYMIAVQGQQLKQNAKDWPSYTRYSVEPES